MPTLKNVYQIDAFTDKPFGGNAAAVVLTDELMPEEMQLIANEMNLSETAFLSSSKVASYRLRWFTPKTEVELCGHATIASIHYLAEQKLINEDEPVTFETKSGVLRCYRKNGVNFMGLPTPSFKKFEGNQDEIIKALGIDNKFLDNKYPFLLQDNGNLFIYVSKLEALKKIKPDFNELIRLSSNENGYSVFTVFTNETFEEHDAHLRFFAPFYGINEDPVTGSANGPLLLVLRELGLIDRNTEEKMFTFEQGDFINRNGRVMVSYSPDKDKLTIAGNAVTVLKGELSF